MSAPPPHTPATLGILELLQDGAAEAPAGTGSPAVSPCEGATLYVLAERARLAEEAFARHALEMVRLCAPPSQRARAEEMLRERHRAIRVLLREMFDVTAQGLAAPATGTTGTTIAAKGTTP